MKRLMKRLKKVFSVLFALVLIIATIVLAISEVKDVGTITGLTLVPFLIGLIWWGSQMITSDIKEILSSLSDDE